MVERSRGGRRVRCAAAAGRRPGVRLSVWLEKGGREGGEERRGREGGRRAGESGGAGMAERGSLGWPAAPGMAGGSGAACNPHALSAPAALRPRPGPGPRAPPRLRRPPRLGFPFFSRRPASLRTGWKARPGPRPAQLQPVPRADPSAPAASSAQLRPAAPPGKRDHSRWCRLPEGARGLGTRGRFLSSLVSSWPRGPQQPRVFTSGE